MASSRVHHSASAEQAFSVSTVGQLTKIDSRLSNKMSHNYVKIIEITESKFSDQKRIKLEINYRKIPGK
jgi:hypothetical protein